MLHADGEENPHPLIKVITMTIKGGRVKEMVRKGGVESKVSVTLIVNQ